MEWGGGGALDPAGEGEAYRFQFVAGNGPDTESGSVGAGFIVVTQGETEVQTIAHDFGMSVSELDPAQWLTVVDANGDGIRDIYLFYTQRLVPTTVPEDQARRRKEVFLKDWAERLDAFLAFNERDVLTGAGRISKKQADAHAENQYEQFAVQRRTLLEAEGADANVRALEDAAKALPKPGKSSRKRK